MAGTKTLTIQIKGDGKDFKVAIDGVEQGLDSAGKKADDTGGRFDGLADKLKDLGGGAVKAGLMGIGGAVAGGGALAIKGLTDAMSEQDIGGKLAAQLGATPADAAKYGEMAGRLYGSNFGSSVEEAAAALKGVTQQIGEGNDAWMEKTAGKALNLASVFEQDLGGTTKAVGQMLKTGLAKDADQAFDILTKGFQNGADKAGDLLDTFNEYGTQFRKLGIDGSTAMGLIQQGLQGGARDADIVADSLKEFSIRAQDGSKTTAEGFAAIGLNSEEMGQKIGAGGDSASGALTETLNALRAIEDPVKRNAAAVELFGTQAEDMGQALFDLDPSTAVQGMGEVAGAADKLGETISGSTTSKIEAFKRNALGKLSDFMSGTVLPGLEDFGKAFGAAFSGEAVDGKGLTAVAATLGEFARDSIPKVQEALGKLKDAADAAFGTMQTVINWLGDHREVVIGMAAAIGTVLVAAVVLYGVSMAEAAVATIAATWPLIAIAAAIGLLVAGIMWAYNNVEIFRNIVQAAFAVIGDSIAIGIQIFQWLWDKVQAVFSAVGIIVKTYIDIYVAIFQWLWDKVVTIFNGVSSAIGTAIDTVKGIFEGFKTGVGIVWDWIQNKISGVVDFITGIPGRVTSALSGIWDSLSSGFRNAINGIINLWNRVHFKTPDVPGTDWGGQDVTVPQITTLHTGGTFRAPLPGGTGLAMLRDREVVSTPGRGPDDASMVAMMERLTQEVMALAAQPPTVVFGEQAVGQVVTNALIKRDRALR